MGVNLIAILWGFAEATFFFIVPDVWLSISAREKLKPGLLACIYSLAGAMLGGIILYVWGANDLEGASRLIVKVPAISNEMLLRVHEELSKLGIFAVMLGPLSGTPYKIYAIQASDTGISFFSFVLISIPARLIRFVLVTVFCHYALQAVKKLHVKTNTLLLLIIGWIVFYTYYFYVMMAK